MKVLVDRQRVSVENQRHQNLLTVLREDGGVWKTGEVARLYRERGWGVCRTTARKDLQHLTRRGFVQEHGAQNNRRYVAVGGGQ
jgi:hypothetical protein